MYFAEAMDTNKKSATKVLWTCEIPNIINDLLNSTNNINSGNYNSSNIDNDSNVSIASTDFNKIVC